jgi:cytochrome subunit of sulfide dehydrogenase
LIRARDLHNHLLAATRREARRMHPGRVRGSEGNGTEADRHTPRAARTRLGALGVIALAWTCAVPASSAGDARHAAALALNCLTCHSRDGAIPTLSGRGAPELIEGLRAFRDGSAPSTIMQRIARGYGDAELIAIADYLAHSQPVRAP